MTEKEIIELEKWIVALPEDKKADLLYTLIDRLIDIDEIKFSPDRVFPFPYWEANGEDISI